MKVFVLPKSQRIGWAAMLLGAWMGTSALRADLQLTVGTAAGAPGFISFVPITLLASSNVAGLQFDLVYDKDSLLRCEVQPGDASAGLNLVSRPLSPGTTRVLIYGPSPLALTNGVLANCQFALAESAPAGVIQIGLSNVVMAAADGSRLADVVSIDGHLAVFGGSLLHDVEDLAWLAGGDPSAAKLTIAVTGQGTNLTLFSGPLAGAKPAWDTRGAADGRYQLNAAFQNAAGQVTKEFIRDVVVNNSVSWHAGWITNSQTWSNTTVHVVESTVVVAPEVTLTVQPGTVIKFARGAALALDNGATLQALGAAGRNIVFTSLADDIGGDVNFDDANSAPKPGDWPGLQAAVTSHIQINEFVEFRYVISVHRGTLVQDEVWDGTHLHRVLDDLTIDSNVTLTIQPGAVVKFELGKKITVLSRAHLTALGTIAQPITFTSIRDDSVGGDTNFDGDRTRPAAGDWGWIFFNGGQGVLDHCLVSFGGGPAEGGWGPSGDPLRTKGMFKTTGTGASLSISNSVLLEAFYDGILAWGGNVIVANTVLAGIDRAVSAHPNSPVRVLNCTLFNNRIGLLIHGGSLRAENTLVAYSLSSGIQYDFGSLDEVRYCNVWSPVSWNSANYRSTSDQTGRNGNLSADPRFKDIDRLNFRLNFGSPCIDAADGALAPATDAMGAPRFTDPRSLHTGTLAENGAFPDIGGFEFADAAPSDIDLVVTEVKGPASAMAGEMAHVEWVVMNRGNTPVNGPWHDAVSLLDAASNKKIQAAEVLVGQGIVLGPGQSYSAGAEVRVPGGLVQGYRWQVGVNSRGEIFEGQNRNNNQSISVGEVAVDLPSLPVNGAALNGRFRAPEEPCWFKFVLETNQDVMVVLDLADNQGVSELYIAKGYLPSLQAYDFRQREWKSADVSALAASAASNTTYYVLAYPRALPSATANFTIRAAEVDFMVERINPTQVGNTGLATLEIFGANLRPGTVFSVQSAQGQRRPAVRTTYVDSGKVYATFPLTNFPAGPASIVADQAGVSAIGSNLLQVVEGGSGSFYAYLTAPKVVRLGRSGTWYLTYGNKGWVDVPLPLLRLTVPGAQNIKLFDSTLNWADGFVLLALNDRSLLPTLGPGQETTISFEVRPGPGGSVDATVEILSGERLIGNPTTINWNSIPVPAGVDPTFWQAELDNLGIRLGKTAGEYYALLMKDMDDLAAAYLGHSYVANIDGQWLFGAEPQGEPFPLPDIVVTPSPQQALPQSPIRLHAPAQRKGDGIRKTYVVIINDSDYWRRDFLGGSDLRSVAKDHEDIKQFFDKDMRIPASHTTDLYDSRQSVLDDINRTNVLNAIKKMKEKVDADDNLVIYYSGHGGRAADGQGYMWLNDGQVSPQDMQQAIEEAGAGTTYFINDSCHSGGLNGNVNPTNSNFVGLAATQSGTVSWGDRTKGSELTTRLKKNLRDCNGLKAAFDKAQKEIQDAYAGQTNAVDRQNPVLNNTSNVNIEGKPWQDPTGFKQKVRDFLRWALGYSAGDKVSTWLVGSFDPNDKVGPIGSGLAGFVGVKQVLPYTIYFENKATAQAPAQEVLILDQLDANLEWATFELSTITFNDVRIPVPAGLQQFTATVHVGSDTNPVAVTASLDPTTGQATWLMKSRDPATGDLPEDPFAGFLPPNDASHRGEGSVSYIIRPKRALATGAPIVNQARIIFDPTYGLNQPIDTPATFNAVDALAPTSRVESLPDLSFKNFALFWQGADDPNGSGVYLYDIYVSRNGGPYEPWLLGSFSTSAEFEGQMGSTYRFYSIARDFAGNVEPAPEQPDAWTQVMISAPELKGRMAAQTFILTVENLAAGKRYLIEQSANLLLNDWQLTKEFVADTTATDHTITLQSGWNRMFFRVRAGE